MNQQEIARTMITKMLVSYGQQVVRAVHTGDIYASQPQVDMIAQLEKIATGTTEQLLGTVQQADAGQTEGQKNTNETPAPPVPEDDSTGGGSHEEGVVLDDAYKKQPEERPLHPTKNVGRRR